MLIKMTKDYKGPIGAFEEGKQYNVGQSVVKRLPGGSYITSDESAADKKSSSKSQAKKD